MANFRTAVDDDVGRAASPSGMFPPEDPNYNINNADWDDRPGLTAKAEAAGFSPVRFHKGKDHTLEVDPRTKLKIVNIPAERRVAFADLQDTVMHVFVDCIKITSSDQHADRVLVITDQSVFLCQKDGAVSRCFMVDRIKTLFVSNDNKALGIEIPSEYDLLVRFQNAADRDRVIKVLRTVFKRLSNNRLPVEMIKKGRKLDPKSFKTKKPPNFRITLIPQHSKEQLREALKLFEDEEEALLEELDLIQDEMEARHQAKMQDLQSTLENDLMKLKSVVKEVWDNDGKLSRMREDVAKGRRAIEQVDGPFSADGEPPVSKDQQIAELELVVARLNASVYAASSDQSRRAGDDAGNGKTTYYQRDLESSLYKPSWPGTDQTGVQDLSSLSQSLTDSIQAVEGEIKIAREVIERGKATETRIRFVEERVAYLRHIHRTGRFNRDATGGAGGLIGGPNRSAMMSTNQGSPSASPRGGGGGGGGGDNMEVYDQSYAWLSDLPQEISEETLTVDPRTGLNFVDLPAVMKPYFGQANGAVLHFFGVVRKASKHGELVKRVVLISDQALYLCMQNATVKRCLDVMDIDEMYKDASLGLGFRCSKDYDLSFVCMSEDHRREIIHIIQRIFKFTSGGRAIPVTDIPRHQRLEAFLKLTPPPGYQMEVIPFRSRKELVEAIREKRDVVVHNAPVSVASKTAMPTDIRMPEEQYVRIRTDVAKQMDYEWRQDSALVQLRAQIDALERQVRTCTDEGHHLKQTIDTHRCEDGVSIQNAASSAVAGNSSISNSQGVIPSTGTGTYRPQSDGLFFINVDPAVVNCELDVLQVEMTRDHFFTGHSNGFVSVWEMDSHRHVRALREHTGRITSMQVTGYDLLTASADSSIRRWDLSTGRCTNILTGHRGAVNSIYREGNRLVSGGADSQIQLWDMERCQKITTFKGHRSSVQAVKFQDDTNTMISVEWGWVLFWDMRHNKVTRSLRDEQGGITCLDFADGIAVAGGSGGDLTVWDVRQGTGDTISGHTDDVLHVQLAGKNCITSGGDYKIRMWDLAGMKSLGVFHDSHPYETPSFRMENKRFISGQGPFVKLWAK